MTKTLTIRCFRGEVYLFTRRGKLVHTSVSFDYHVQKLLFGDERVTGYCSYRVKVTRSTSKPTWENRATFKVIGIDNHNWATDMLVLKAVTYSNPTCNMYVCTRTTNQIFGKTTVGDYFTVVDAIRKELQ